MPFQFDIRRSSPSDRPYEQASMDPYQKISPMCFHGENVRDTAVSTNLLPALSRLSPVPLASESCGALSRPFFEIEGGLESNRMVKGLSKKGKQGR